MTESRETSRPQTTALSKTFTNANLKKACEELTEWVDQEEIKRSQLIAITLNETEIEEGDQMLTVFYRKDPIEEGETPFQELKFKLFNANHSWEKLQKEANAEKHGVDLVHLTQSPKNINEMNQQIMWYAKGSNAAGTPEFKYFSLDNGQWSELAEDVHAWMNQYVPPHMLISVSFYADKHDGESKVVQACVAHSAGSNPEDISEKNTGITEIYQMFKVGSPGGFDNLFNPALNAMNKIGGQEGHCVASTNDNNNDGGFIAVYSWTGSTEGAYRDVVRPSTCGGCSIF